MRRKIQNKKKTNIRKAEIEMTNFDYYAPTKVVFGKGTEDQVGELVKEQGCTKVLVHYGSGSVKKKRSAGSYLSVTGAGRDPFCVTGRCCAKSKAVSCISRH